MNTWHYEHGQWAETTFLDDARREAEGREDLQSWRALCQHLGYQDYTSIGDEDCFEITVYEREAPPRYLVMFSDCNRGDAMTAGTLPDAMDLLARYAPIVTAGEVAEVGAGLRNHDSHNIVSDVLISASLNAASISAQEQAEREMRGARRRAAQERRTLAKSE